MTTISTKEPLTEIDSVHETAENSTHRKRTLLAFRDKWYVAVPIALWQFFVGVLLCQTLLGAVIVVGWTQRLMRRAVLKSWWKQSSHQETGLSFDQYLASLSDPASPRALPNWCLAERANAQSVGPIRRLIHVLSGSLWKNLRQGAAGALNIFVWTLPATALWSYAWLLGWNISFFKLYEQSHFGILLGMFGNLLFILAMLYVPLAHVRQSVTGSWRCFYDLRVNWRLARRGAGMLLPLAIGFAVASAAVTFMRMLPYFMGTEIQYAEMSAEALRKELNDYFFLTGLFIFPAYVLLWFAASKVYARAALREYFDCPLANQSPGATLRMAEREALRRLELEAPTRNDRRGLLPAARWTTGKLATAALLIATSAVWFFVAFEVFVGQFFNYIPVVAWHNHPLVLLPWIHYIPPSLMP